MTNSRVTCGPCNRGEHDKCYGSPPATAVVCDCRDAGHQRSSKEKVIATLLERLTADGGRYLLSIALTDEERNAQEQPTYGSKGFKRWLTEDEHAALVAALQPTHEPRADLAEIATILVRYADWFYTHDHEPRGRELSKLADKLRAAQPPSEYPEELFDGYAVERELTGQARRRTSTENVIDVLDAVVRLMKKRRARPTKSSARCQCDTPVPAMDDITCANCGSALGEIDGR